MFKGFRNRKVGTKVTFVVALLLLLSLAVVGYMSFATASEALFESYSSTLTAQASQTAEILSDKMKMIELSMEEAALAIQDASEYKVLLQSVLQQQREKLGYIYLGYTAADGTTTASGEIVLDLSQEPGFQRALEGQMAMGRPEVLEEDGALYFHLFAPVEKLNGTIGVLSALIPYQDIYQYIQDIQVGETGFIVVLDEDGAVAMHEEPSLVAAKSNNTILQDGQSEYSEMSKLQIRALAGETGFGQYALNNSVKYMAFAPVPNEPYVILLTVPKAELFSMINDLMYMIIIASGISLIVMMVVLLVFMRIEVSRPLKRAAAFAKDLSEGTLDGAIEIRAKDEVGQLSATLDKEVRQAFQTIEKNRVIVDKQRKYQGEHVDKLVVNLERLASGELYCDMAVAEPDEDTREIYDLYQKISDNMHLTINTLKTYISEISTALGAMSDGNLNVSIKSEFHGDFTALKDAINSIANSLSQVMAEINAAAEQVAAGTKQVSDGSQEISQGATEQAGAIEELSATITQMAEQTKQNAESATMANELTLSAKDTASQGNDKMKMMQNAMTEINEASENISKIIKVIDDIAFQTNILALNAAVEAARAGVHGKGFAVVAEEVRNLAAKSADAAKQTTALIEGSVKKTEAGTRIADETAQALGNIVNGVEKAAQLVGEIAAASEEQAGAITQVNGGIEQVSQVVQTNSATSEETAASAEELSSQAQMLKGMVGRFTLKEETDTETPDDTEKTEPESLETPKESDEPYIALNDDDFGKY